VNQVEQLALARGMEMMEKGESLRKIAAVWKDEFGLPEYDAKSVARIVSRAVAAIDRASEYRAGVGQG
jgi:hypothetical protein